MTHRFADIAFTDAVRNEQERRGSRALCARMHANGGPNDALGVREAQLLARTDSCFLATVSETGWPYVQHRGGPPGFLHVLTPTRIAFADFRGNRQYVSVGNAALNDRAALIVVDHAHRLRLKLLGHLRFVDLEEADAALAQRVSAPHYRAHVERVALVDIVGFDWNCPQHIPQRV